MIGLAARLSTPGPCKPRSPSLPPAIVIANCPLQYQLGGLFLGLRFPQSDRRSRRLITLELSQDARWRLCCCWGAEVSVDVVYPGGYPAVGLLGVDLVASFFADEDIAPETELELQRIRRGTSVALGVVHTARRRRYRREKPVGIRARPAERLVHR